MIEVNELRYGSIVYFSNYEPVHESQIRRFGWNDFEQLSIDEHAERYSPIPLTPEILEKCGFEIGQTFTSNKGYLTEYDFVSGNTCLTFYDGEIILSQSDEDYENNIIKLPAPKFLHQLQNVWPFLTGEELTINL